MARLTARHVLVAIAGVVALAATPAPVVRRPAADMARDGDRKPAAMVSFAGIRPGQTVVDMLPGGGYFTRVFAAAVGPGGRVVAFVPAALAKRNPQAASDMQALAAEPGYANVTVTVALMSALVVVPGTADVVWTSQNYHDLHNPALPADTLMGVNKAVFAALKPGGTYVVLDHAAAAGSGLRDVATLHRIDPATVKAEVVSAGFRFDGASTALANPADDHKSKVFDPAIRGHTDQFVFRFRKPR